MSKDPDRFAGSNLLARFAQRRTRAIADPGRGALSPPDIEFIQADEETRRSEERNPRVAAAGEHYFYVDGFPVPRSLGSTRPPSADCRGHLREPQFSHLKKIVPLLVVGGFASIVTMIVLDIFPGSSSSATGGLAATVVPQSAPGKTNQMAMPSPQVILDHPASGVDVTVPLNASLRGALEGTNLTVSGVPAGTTVSPGRQLKPGLWRIEAAQLGSVTIHPPPGFTGKMKLALELRRADGTIVDRQPVRLDWAGASTDQASGIVRPTGAATMMTPAKAAINQVEHTPVTPLNPHEISVLVNRGDEYLKAGQIAAARLVLQRAADAHDPRGTLMLGATYDPIVLERLGVLGLTANAETARIWYEKAKEFGSSEAPRRIDMLASWNH
jgi:hypothetical protein